MSECAVNAVLRVTESIAAAALSHLADGREEHRLFSQEKQYLRRWHLCVTQPEIYNECPRGCFSGINFLACLGIMLGLPPVLQMEIKTEPCLPQVPSIVDTFSLVPSLQGHSVC